MRECVRTFCVVCICICACVCAAVGNYVRACVRTCVLVIFDLIMPRILRLLSHDHQFH